MLRFFRTIRKKLIEQDNVRKYLLYAIGEILLVVIGILIALQVNNWNESRLENIKADEYLNRLSENLDEDRTLIINRVSFLNEVMKYAKIAIGHAENTTSENIGEWETLLAYFQSSQIYPLVLTDVTYNELKSAGELDLIKNFQLRKDLAIYYGEQYQQYLNTVGTIPVYREKIRGVIPFHIQEYIWVNCHKTESTKQILIHCEKPEYISKETIVTILNDIKNSHVIIHLRFWASNLEVGLDILNSQLDQADSLTALINYMNEK